MPHDCPSGKWSYDKPGALEARNHLRRPKGRHRRRKFTRKLYYYRCDLCGHYHLTKIPHRKGRKQ